MERHHWRLLKFLYAIRLDREERRSLVKRCVGWWPSLEAYIAEQLTGMELPLPPEVGAALIVVGQWCMDEELFAVVEEPGEGGGVFILRV